MDDIADLFAGIGGSSPAGSVDDLFSDIKPPAFVQRNPMAAAPTSEPDPNSIGAKVATGIAGGVTGAIEGFKEGFGEGLSEQELGPLRGNLLNRPGEYWPHKTLTELGIRGVNTLFRGLGGGIEAAAHGVQGALEPFDPELARTMGGMLEYEMTRGDQPLGVHERQPVSALTGYAASKVGDLFRGLGGEPPLAGEILPPEGTPPGGGGFDFGDLRTPAEGPAPETLDLTPNKPPQAFQDIDLPGVNSRPGPTKLRAGQTDIDAGTVEAGAGAVREAVDEAPRPVAPGEAAEPVKSAEVPAKPLEGETVTGKDVTPPEGPLPDEEPPSERERQPADGWDLLDAAYKKGEAEDGFVTSTGRFVSREEAASIEEARRGTRSGATGEAVTMLSEKDVPVMSLKKLDQEANEFWKQRIALIKGPIGVRDAGPGDAGERVIASATRVGKDISLGPIHADSREAAVQRLEAEHFDTQARAQKFKGKAPPQDANLLDFVAHIGVKPSAELTAIAATGRGGFRPGYGAMVRANGKDLDRVREAAAEAGYLPANSTPADLLNLIDRGLRGEDIRPQGYVPPPVPAAVEREAERAQHDAETAVNDALAEMGAAEDPELAERAAALVLAGEDPYDAIERASLQLISEDLNEADKQAISEASGIPFFDDAAPAEQPDAVQAGGERGGEAGAEGDGSRPAGESPQGAEPAPDIAEAAAAEGPARPAAAAPAAAAPEASDLVEIGDGHPVAQDVSTRDGFAAELSARDTVRTANGNTFSLIQANDGWRLRITRQSGESRMTDALPTKADAVREATERAFAHIIEPAPPAPAPLDALKTALAKPRPEPQAAPRLEVPEGYEVDPAQAITHEGRPGFQAIARPKGGGEWKFGFGPTAEGAQRDALKNAGAMVDSMPGSDIVYHADHYTNGERDPQGRLYENRYKEDWALNVAKVERQVQRLETRAGRAAALGFDPQAKGDYARGGILEQAGLRRLTSDLTQARDRLAMARDLYNKALPRPPSPQAEAAKSGWKPIGKNRNGEPLFEDERGVRSYVKDGIRISEKVRLGPRGTFDGIAEPRTGLSDFLAVNAAEAPNWAEVLAAAPRVPDKLRGSRPDADAIFRLIGEVTGGKTKFDDLTPDEKFKVLEEVRNLEAKAAEPVSEPPKVKDTSTAPAEEPAPQDPKSSGWGDKNTFVNKDRAAEIRRQILEELKNSTSAGYNPKLLMLGAELAAFHIEAGARAFADFAKAIVGDLGLTLAEVRPYINVWYNSARDMLENAGLDVADMDTPEQVRAAMRTLGTEETADVSQGVREGSPGIPAKAEPESVPGSAGERPAGGPRQAGGRGRRGNGRKSVGGDDGADQPRDQGQADGGAAAGTPDDSVRGDGDRGGGTDQSTAAGLNTAKASVEDGRAARIAANYRIKPEDQIGVGGPKVKARGNIEAIRTLKLIEEQNREATPDEKAIMVKYVGWGAFSEKMFADRDAEWRTERSALKDLLTPDEYAAARASTTNAHYTSEAVINGMWKAVDHLGFKGGRVLEPSAGVGHFIGLQPLKMAEKSRWSAVELDSITGRIAAKLYGGADVNVMGYEKFERPPNFYDLAISNVPFGSYNLRDPKLGTHLIHDFFFLKAIGQVRPGGVVAFITSSGTMDKGGNSVRVALARQADFLGAIRLPGGDKGAFAGNAGTEVTTDIVFLRKRAPGEAPTDLHNEWAKTDEIDTPEGKTRINEYFAKHPEMMLGEMRLLGSMYRERSPVLIGEQAGLEDRIAVAAQKLRGNIVGDHTGKENRPAQATVEASVATKPGAFFVEKGGVFRKSGGVGVAVQMSAADGAKVKALVEMRDIYNALLARRKTDNPVLLRDQLNRAYDKFVGKFGPISKVVTTVTTRLNKFGEPIVIRKMPNFKPFRDDPDAYKVLALENYDEEKDQASKAAIFTTDVVGDRAPPAVNSPADAIAVSLDRHGDLNPQTIADLLKQPVEGIMQKLGDLVYEDPNGDLWRPTEEYLSGDVLTKLEEARAAAKSDDRYARNVEALEKVQPATIEPSEIQAQFGAPWVPIDVYEQFLKDVVGATAAKLSRNAMSNGWLVKDGTVFGRDAQAKWGTDRVDVQAIVAHAMNNTRIRVMDPGEPPEFNPEATQAAQVKVDALRRAFTGDPESGEQGWWVKDQDRTERLQALYNRAFNRYVKRDYSGEHLSLPGIATSISAGAGKPPVPFALRPHQKSAVWRIIQKGNTLLDHEVGAGKTFTMIAAAMEQQRLGLIHRPMFVVPNHMLEQFSREFLQAYPNASILVADKESMSAAKRAEFAGRIAAEKWNGIIITHDAFGRLGMSHDFVTDFINAEIDEFVRARDEALADGEDRRSPTVKQQEAAIRRLQARLEKHINAERKDKGANFEELGVDHLVVDEAHLFKNLSIATKMTRVKGLGGGDAQRALDLFMKVRYLEGLHPGRSATFATGTPVSNTLAEMYVMQRYLQLETLKAHGIDRFDAWAQTFGEIVNRMELAPDGRTFKETSSFSRFVNIPELVSIYSQVADTKTAEMLKLPRPDLRIQASGANAGKRVPTIVEAEPTEQESAYIDQLVQRARGPFGRPEKGADNMLKIVSEGRKVATDFRLIDANAPFNPKGKTALLVDNVSRIWKETTPTKSAQMIFLDMGTPKNSKGKAAVKEKPEAGKIEIDDEGNIVESDVEDSVLYASDFNLYEDIRQRLMQRGIPKSEIAFIHEAGDDIKKGVLFDKVRRGVVRVIIGSTGKMGVGTNVQKLLIALHHFDAPWKPAEVTQRDGRILRQGNDNAEIDIFRYVLKRSFDSFMWQTLERKAGFLAQLRAGARGVRTMEDIDDPLPDAAQMKAAAAGDPRIMRHAELTKEVRDLDVKRRSFQDTIYNSKRALNEAQRSKAALVEIMPSRQADAARVKDLSGDKFAVNIGGTDFVKRDAAGKAIRETLLQRQGNVWASRDKPERIELGQLSGFHLAVNAYREKSDKGPGQVVFSPVLKGDNEYGGHWTAGFAVGEEATQEMNTGLMRRFEAKLRDVTETAQQTKAKLDQVSAEVPKLQEAAADKPFPREAEYQKAKADLAQLTKDLTPPKPDPNQPAAAIASDIPSFAGRLTAQERDTANRDVDEIVRRIAGKNIGLRKSQTIPYDDTFNAAQREATAEGVAAGELRSSGTVGGSFSYPTATRRAIIDIAMNDDNFDPRTSAGHESWHAVEESGVISTPDKAILDRDQDAIDEWAANELWGPERAKTMAQSPTLKRLPIEERRAIAFGMYRRQMEEGSGRPPPGAKPLGRVAAIFEKIRKMLDAIRAVFTKKGIRTFREIFEETRQGDYGPEVDKNVAPGQNQPPAEGGGGGEPPEKLGSLLHNFGGSPEERAERRETRATVRKVEDDLHRLSTNTDGDKIILAQALDRMPARVKDIESDERWYHYIEDPDSVGLTDQERADFHEYMQPLLDKQTELYRYVRSQGFDPDIDASANLEDLSLTDATPNYIHRIVAGRGNARDVFEGAEEANPITGPKTLNRSAPSMIRRSMLGMTAHDGTRRVLSVTPRGMTSWLNGQGTKIVDGPKPQLVRPGVQFRWDGRTWTVDNATTMEIEAHTNLTYYKSAIINTMDNLVRLARAARNIDLLNDMLVSPEFEHLLVRDAPDPDAGWSASGGIRRIQPPAGWKRVDIPQLRDYWFDPRLAAALNDYYSGGKLLDHEVGDVVRGANRIMIGSLFWSPMAHIANVGWHWWVGRGFDNVRRPIPIITMARAWRSVIRQDSNYVQILREGGAMIEATNRNRAFYETMLRKAGVEIVRNYSKFEGLARHLGFGRNGVVGVGGVIDMVRSIYRGSSHALWFSNDVFMVARIYELMDAHKLTLSEAIEEAAKHIPDYRIRTTVAGSRLLSKILQDNLVINFGRYTVGRIFNSYGHMIGDLIKGGTVGNTSKRFEALGVILALGVLVFIFDPAWQALWQKITGDKTLRTIRRGPSALPGLLMDMAAGHKTSEDLLQSIFNLAPTVKEPLQQLTNKDFFTGQEIGTGSFGQNMYERAKHALEDGVALTGQVEQPNRTLLQQFGLTHERSPAAIAAERRRASDAARRARKEGLPSFLTGR